VALTVSLRPARSLSPALRRLTALAAAFVPDRAERLLGLVSGSMSKDASAQAAALARRPRQERLDALAAALAPAMPAAFAERLEPRHPLLRRLARETFALSVRATDQGPH
jgi:hypothetical protein